MTQSPNSEDDASLDDASSRWRSGATILGAVEMLAGAGLLALGCRGWLAGDSLSNVAGTYALLFGLFFLIVPGALLCFRDPPAWLGQLLPALLVGAYLVMLLLH